MIENIDYSATSQTPSNKKKEKTDRYKKNKRQPSQRDKTYKNDQNKESTRDTERRPKPTFTKKEHGLEREQKVIAHQISILPSESIPQPEKTNENFSSTDFSDLGINEYLKKCLAKADMTTMTKVQKKSIPIILKHRNVVVKSETGSGKTLCYAIPLFQHLFEVNSNNPIKRNDGIHAIVFAPTHELCLQIENTFNRLRSSCINAVFGCLIGGQRMEIEKRMLRKGLNVLICTPSRLLYHIENSANLNFSSLSSVILDEADILLDMGFGKTIQVIFEKLSNGQETKDYLKKSRITLVSATIDNSIRELATFLMKGFKTVGMDSKEEESEAVPTGLNQYYLPTFDEFKLIHLICLLGANDPAKSIVFVHTCEQANFLYELFKNVHVNGKKLFEFEFLKLHGKMKHDERHEIFKKFNKGDSICLIATDVASRGLDFPDVQYVYQFDINPDPKEYLNRMGRTARLTKKGSSVLFLMPHEEPLLQSHLGKFNIQRLSPEDCIYHLVKAKEFITDNAKYGTRTVELGDDNEKFRKKFLFAIQPLQIGIKDVLFSGEKEVLSSARRAFKSNLRAYAMLNKIEKTIFHVKNLNLSRYVSL